MLITISRKAKVRAKSADIDARVALKDGLVSEESCGRHLYGGLEAFGFDDGRIRLGFDTDHEHWRVQTQYLTSASLDQAQIDLLVKQTLAQWSDGLGEGCFDEAAEAAGVSIDLAPLDADDAPSVLVDAKKTPDKRGKPSLDLYKAVEKGDLSKINRLIDEGADLEFGDEGHTPLHNAILCGLPEVALALLERGADPKAVYAGFGNGDPVDPLMEAALSNSLSDANAAVVAKALLERGVDPNGERDGYTPLVMADVREKSQMMEVLREFGATA
ncbi:MAG: ankyrin repeat domain-containing protein [Pseudomonadota bacterium]